MAFDHAPKYVGFSGRPKESWWTLEMEVELERLWNAKILSASEIGGLMGCSRSAIIGKAHRMNLVSRAPAGGPKNGHGPRKRRTVVVMANISQSQPKIPAPANQPVDLIDLEHYHCRFIVGSSAQAPNLALFCGARKTEGAYCEYHAAQCYNFSTHRQSAA